MRIRIRCDALACGAGKAISNRIMEKVVGVQVNARCSMQPKWIPGLLASADRWEEKWHHGVPSKGVGECTVVQRVKEEAWDKAGIEW